MDGKGESLCKDVNSFLVLHSHHVCNGKPPDEAETFLMAKNTTHTGRISAQPHTIVKQICFPSGNVLFL